MVCGSWFTRVRDCYTATRMSRREILAEEAGPGPRFLLYRYSPRLMLLWEALGGTPVSPVTRAVFTSVFKHTLLSLRLKKSSNTMTFHPSWVSSSSSCIQVRLDTSSQSQASRTDPVVSFATLLDVQKTFDTVWYNSLHAKLPELSILQWVSDFIDGRTAHIHVGDDGALSATSITLHTEESYPPSTKQTIYIFLYTMEVVSLTLACC